MTSIFEGQPLKTKPFQTKTRVIWVPGIYIYISTMVSIFFCMFTPTCGNDPIWRADFFNWFNHQLDIYIIYYMYIQILKTPTWDAWSLTKQPSLGCFFHIFTTRRSRASSLGRFYMGINWQWNEFGSPKICWNTFLWCNCLANLNLLGQYA